MATLCGTSTKSSPVTDMTPELPKDWRQFNIEHLKQLDPQMRQTAAHILREIVIPKDHQPKIVNEAADPLWWVAHHHGYMTWVRNQLRQEGFGEKELKIDCLDDYAVGLVELALGVIKEGQLV